MKWMRLAGIILALILFCFALWDNDVHRALAWLVAALWAGDSILARHDL